MTEMLIGHRAVFDELRSSELAAATLLLGPEGTGKWVLALVLADTLGYPRYDTYGNKGPLLVSHVETVQAFCRTAGGPLGKLVLLCLDGASAMVQNALLKLLEDTPAGVKFILVAGEPPLPTIVSRSFVYRCGLLSTDEVEQVLLALGQQPVQATTAALLSGGRVSTALSVAGAAEDVLGRVRAALKAASDRDSSALGCVSSRVWDDRHHLLLKKWASEAYAGYWRVFYGGDAPKLSREDARYALHMLCGLDGGRAWIIDRAVLEQLAARSST